jgi:hypothetical protein
MLFATLVFISAFLIESIGSYISIVGLSALFSTNPVIIALALSLDIAKVVTVSFLYKQWNLIPRGMKYYMTVAAVILMVITSSGAAGYLSAEFQKAIIPTKGSEIMVKSMGEEKTRLEARKVEIDKQISQLPPENVRGRQKLQKQFAGELEHINGRIVEIDKELPKLQMEQVDINAHAGPILYIAQAFDTTVESAVKYVILLIIFVFDPLAVALIIAGNFLLDQRKRERDEISDKLDEIKTDVKHIEEELEDISAPKNNFVVEDFVSLRQEDKRNKGTEVETLPQAVIDDSQEPEIPAPAVFDKAEFDAAAFEQCDTAIEAEAAQQEPAGLVELVVESDTPVRVSESPKRKRGRKKKDEAEPKPSITTEEQLSEVISAEIVEEVEEPIIEEVAVEPVIAEEPAEVVAESSLGKVNHEKADVAFLRGSEGDGTWKPTKQVLNIYHKA